MLQGQVACYKLHATRANYMLQVRCYKGKLHTTRASCMLQGQVTCYKLHATGASYMLQVTCYKLHATGASYMLKGFRCCCCFVLLFNLFIASHCHRILVLFSLPSRRNMFRLRRYTQTSARGRGWGVSGKNADWNLSPLTCQDQHERYFHTKHNRP